jgi:hypothetical protein
VCTAHGKTPNHGTRQGVRTEDRLLELESNKQRADKNNAQCEYSKTFVGAVDLCVCVCVCVCVWCAVCLVCLCVYEDAKSL